MAFFIRGAEMLLTALGVPVGCEGCRSGNSPEFRAQQKEWLETSTRDSILADLTRNILPNTKHGGRRGVFVSPEVVNLESVFAAHADKINNCWDQNSLESYLLTQIPNDEKSLALLRSCIPYLWKLVTYFSQWPFINTAPTTDTTYIPTARLRFDAFVRANAFLSGRHSIMLSQYEVQSHDAFVPRRRTRRTDRLVLEHMFRALALDVNQTDQDAKSSSSSSSYSLYDDVLDTLNTVQPNLDPCHTTSLGGEQLNILAMRLLAPPNAPAAVMASSLTISTVVPDEIFALTDLFIFLLQHIIKFDKSGVPEILAKQLETARTELGKVDSISFDAFIKWLGADDYCNLYDSVALLFNTFPNPKSLTEGIMINHFSEERENLFVFGLRRPGSSIVVGD